jgi:hypothetical protein
MPVNVPFYTPRIPVGGGGGGGLNVATSMSQKTTPSLEENLAPIFKAIMMIMEKRKQEKRGKQFDVLAQQMGLPTGLAAGGDSGIEQLLLKMAMANQVSPKPLLPTQQLAGEKLTYLKKLQAIPEGQRTKEQQASLNKLLIGQPLVEIGIGGKPAPSGERESLNKLYEFDSELQRIETLFDPAFIGRLEGNWGTFKEFTGLGATEKESQFRQVVKNIGDTLLRLRSGAQINEQEYKRLLKLVPTIDLPDTVFSARLKSLRTAIRSSIGIRRKTLEQSGFKAPEGTTISVSGNLTPDEETELAELETLEAQQ